MKLTDIKGIGNKKSEILNSLNIFSVEDLYTYLPNRYEDRSNKIDIINSVAGVKNYYVLEIITNSKTYFYGKNKSITRLRAKDDSAEINIIWYNDRFTAKNLKLGEKYKFYGVYDLEKKAIINPIISKIKDDLIGGIIPIYSLKKGVSEKEIIKYKDYLFSTDFKLDDYFTINDKNRFNLLDINDIYVNLHRPKDHSILYKSIFNLNLRNIFLDKLANKIYIDRLNRDHIKFNDIDLSIALEKLQFKLSEDQKKAISDIKNDMISNKRMNRIIIGDVGSGKTIVAILSAIIAFKNGYQVAFMTPTEILAIQHFENYKKFFYDLNIKSSLLTGSTSSLEKKKIYKDLIENKIDIIFGTHSLFQEKVDFNKLGLIITDEQQRFGVYQRKQLVDKGINPDILLLSATPIPRTLALSFYNNLDISFIENKPKNRLAIKSYVKSINQEKSFIDFAYSRILSGEQVYIVVPRVEKDEHLESIESIFIKLKKYFSDKVKIDILHGKMTNLEKEEKQSLFSSGKIDILIATSIIEVGIDNPNATVMIIYNANQFGLSQLHQIRGRVGRSNLQSYCFFVLGKYQNINDKIDFIAKNNDGFKIAKKDLELRGSGEIFGLNQSGFIELDNFNILNEKLVDKVNELIENIDMNNKNLMKIINSKLEKLDKIILN